MQQKRAQSYPGWGTQRVSRLGLAYRYDRRSKRKLQACNQQSWRTRPMNPDPMLESLREPVQITPRFRAAVETRIMQLERDAAADERVLAPLTSPDHRRRQQMLVDKQLEKAFRLREMLALVITRSARARREPVR